MTQSNGYHICEMNCVFICSPFKGDVKANIENAKKYARFAALKGNAVFVPHLLYPQFLDDASESEREIGIQSGIEFMHLCDEVWVFAKDEASCTEGMKKEIDAAKKDKFLRIKFFDPKTIS